MEAVWHRPGVGWATFAQYKYYFKARRETNLKLIDYTNLCEEAHRFICLDSIVLSTCYVRAGRGFQDYDRPHS